jgi:hypothetical protein
MEMETSVDAMKLGERLLGEVDGEGLSEVSKKMKLTGISWRVTLYPASSFIYLKYALLYVDLEIY